MKMTTKGRYGLRAMADLAVHHDGDNFIPLKHISERQHISENYLERLMAGLRRSGLVQAQRGTQGGYRLARKPEEITVRDILEAVREPMALTDCVEEGQTSCRGHYCTSRKVWQKMTDSLIRMADSITLYEMVHGEEHDR